MKWRVELRGMASLCGIWGSGPHSFLQASDLLPGLHILPPGLQKLLIGQVKSLANGERYLLSLEHSRRSQSQESWCSHVHNTPPTARNLHAQHRLNYSLTHKQK